MRRILAILFFLPFFIAQNIHYLHYVHCRVVNAVQDNNNKCDCGKELDSALEKATGNNPVNQDMHIHAHLDNYFRHVPQQALPIAFPVRKSNESFSWHGHIARGYSQKPWRPPAIVS